MSEDKAAALQGVWASDLEATTRRETPWLWDGYLAAGNVTLLTSQWKTGKTTLLSVLLARRVTGGAVAGRALAAAGSTSAATPGSCAGRSAASRRRRSTGR